MNKKIKLLLGLGIVSLLGGCATISQVKHKDLNTQNINDFRSYMIYYTQKDSRLNSMVNHVSNIYSIDEKTTLINWVGNSTTSKSKLFLSYMGGYCNKIGGVTTSKSWEYECNAKDENFKIFEYGEYFIIEHDKEQKNINALFNSTGVNYKEFNNKHWKDVVTQDRSSSVKKFTGHTTVWQHNQNQVYTTNWQNKNENVGTKGFYYNLEPIIDSYEYCKRNDGKFEIKLSNNQEKAINFKEFIKTNLTQYDLIPANYIDGKMVYPFLGTYSCKNTKYPFEVKIGFSKGRDKLYSAEIKSL